MATRGLIGLALGFGLVLAACGEESGEVRLAIQEDASLPCLGAAHLHVRVMSPARIREYHEFGQFFGLDTRACVNGEYRYEGLSFANGVQVTLQMWDSTSDIYPPGQGGLLASGTSLPIDVKGGQPITQLVVPLGRTPDCRLGTVILIRPDDWDNFPQLDALQYSISEEGAGVPLRSGYFAVFPERMSNPFPLIISNLPVSAVNTPLSVRVDGLGASLPPNAPPVLRTWTATAFLGGDAPNPGYAALR
jgi:hypothetical protein